VCVPMFATLLCCCHGCHHGCRMIQSGPVPKAYTTLHCAWRGFSFLPIQSFDALLSLRSPQAFLLSRCCPDTTIPVVGGASSRRYYGSFDYSSGCLAIPCVTPIAVPADLVLDDFSFSVPLLNHGSNEYLFTQVLTNPPSRLVVPSRIDICYNSNTIGEYPVLLYPQWL
jgi:hypothetical protein